MSDPGIEIGPLSSQFAIQLPAIVNVVGAGGKTGLILALLEEYSSTIPVLYTTTTRIHPPPIRHGLAIISCDSRQLLEYLIRRIGILARVQKGAFVVTRPEISPGLLKGLDPGFGVIVERDNFPLVLNEADGARSMSIKFPRPGEPVLMDNADYLVPVLGIDCIGKPLGPETLFRWELASQRLSLRAGKELTVHLAASLLLHPDGVCKDWRPGMRIVPYINKVDSPAEDSLAVELAYELLQDRNFPIERVVWGSVQNRRARSLVACRQ